jgi:hypothetical protein
VCLCVPSATLKIPLKNIHSNEKLEIRELNKIQAVRTVF